MVKSGNTCAVAICPSPPEATYHVFPKNDQIQKLWIELCKRKETINVKTARICSNHFNDQDYERDFQNEILGLPTRKRLNFKTKFYSFKTNLARYYNKYCYF
jgi:hypothetical protein